MTRRVGATLAIIGAIGNEPGRKRGELSWDIAGERDIVSELNQTLPNFDKRPDWQFHPFRTRVDAYVACRLELDSVVIAGPS